MRNPYTVLGVAKTADEKQIKSAFRKLAMQYHPDHNKDDPAAQAKFAEINQAYEIIGDKDKRGQFDRGEIDAEGKPAFQGGFGGGSPFGAGGRQQQGGGAGFSGFDFHNMGGSRGGNFGGGMHIDESILRDIFGSAGGSPFGGFGGNAERGGRTRQAPRKGADITANLEVSLAQLAGAEKLEVAFSDGKKLKIKLPTYLEDGQVIRLKGQGQSVQGGASGDALITIRFAPDRRFRIEGRELHMDLDIGLKTAILGGKETVETLDGAVAVTVPAWTSSDKVLRLKDRGLPLKDGGRAPLYIHLRLMLPPLANGERDKKLENWAQNFRPE